MMSGTVAISSRMFAKVGLAVVLGAGLAASAQADTIQFNPSGGQFSPTYTVNGLAFGAGNALAVGSISNGAINPNTTFTLYFQTHLTGLTGPNAPPAVAGLNTSYQITEVASFQERVTSITTTPGTGTTVTFSIVPSASNLVNIYYNSAVVFNDAAGTGFTAGTIIASLRPTSENSTFTDTTNTAGGPNGTTKFNSTGAGNGTNATADTGSGSTQTTANVSSGYNTNFFQPPSGLPLLNASLLNSNLSSAFDSVSASLLFTNPNGGPSFAPNNVGNGTGNNGTTGPDFQLQVSGITESFTVAVPEPASVLMTVLGLGGAGLASVVARRRKA